MIKCGSCGFENADGSNFCKKCGTKLEAKKYAKFCRFCGKEAPEGTLFCTSCGKSLEITADTTAKITKQPEKQAQVVAQKPVVEDKPVHSEDGKKKNLMPIIIPVLIIIVAVVIGIVWFMQNDAGDKNSSRNPSSNVETDVQDDEKDEEKQEESNSQNEEQGESEELPETVQEVDRSAPIPLSAVVTASSSYDHKLYAETSLSDSNAATSWAEGAVGYGVGEFFMYTFSGEILIYGMAILPGNLSTIDEFNSCSYPTKFEIIAGDQTQVVEVPNFNFDFNFTKNPYLYIDFEEPVKAKEVQIKIAEVYENINSDVTSIAELRLYTYPVKGQANNYTPDAWKVVHVKATDYILPTSNIAFLTMDDLQGLTAEECRIARNELYARYGRKFTDEALKAYFESKEWYVGTIEPEDFEESMLNEYEIANRDLIVQYEIEQGYRE